MDAWPSHWLRKASSNARGESKKKNAGVHTLFVFGVVVRGGGGGGGRRAGLTRLGVLAKA